MVPCAAGGRVYRHHAHVGVADAAPGGRARLDAVARWLQDAARADVVDAGLIEVGAWVVRTARLRVERFPRFGDELLVETFCSGVGSLWAERRTTVRGGAGVLVEAVALWVHVDPGIGRPLRLGDEFDAVYGAAANGRQVKARLRHPAPPPDARARPWTFRAADLDVAGHVNNANYWQVLEEELLAGAPIAAIDAEIEHRNPADAGRAEVRSEGALRWVTGADGELHASFLITDARRPAIPAA